MKRNPKPRKERALEARNYAMRIIRARGQFSDRTPGMTAPPFIETRFGGLFIQYRGPFQDNEMHRPSGRQIAEAAAAGHRYYHWPHSVQIGGGKNGAWGLSLDWNDNDDCRWTTWSNGPWEEMLPRLADEAEAA